MTTSGARITRLTQTGGSRFMRVPSDVGKCSSRYAAVAA